MSVGRAVVGAGRLAERLARIGPVKGMGHRGVVIVEELAELLLQIGHGGEVAPPHDLPHDYPKRRLHLVQPRTVLRQVDEPDAMGRIAQEFAACRL